MDSNRTGRKPANTCAVPRNPGARHMTMAPMKSESSSSPNGGRNRIVSMDTGLSALYTSFYQQKLEIAKKKADAELRGFLSELKATLNEEAEMKRAEEEVKRKEEEHLEQQDQQQLQQEEHGDGKCDTDDADGSVSGTVGSTISTGDTPAAATPPTAKATTMAADVAATASPGYKSRKKSEAGGLLSSSSSSSPTLPPASTRKKRSPSFNDAETYTRLRGLATQLLLTSYGDLRGGVVQRVVAELLQLSEKARSSTGGARLWDKKIQKRIAYTSQEEQEQIDLELKERYTAAASVSSGAADVPSFAKGNDATKNSGSFAVLANPSTTGPAQSVAGPNLILRVRKNTPLPQRPVQTLLSRLLLIISKFSRLVGYLNIDHDEIQQFLTWTSEISSKKDTKEPSPSWFRAAHSKQPRSRAAAETATDRAALFAADGIGSGGSAGDAAATAGSDAAAAVDAKVTTDGDGASDEKKMVVCRICEEKVEEASLENHTETCVWLSTNITRCKCLDDALGKLLNDLEQDVTRDISRIQKFDGGEERGVDEYFELSQKAEDYTKKLVELLPPADFRQLQEAMRNRCYGKQEEDTLIEKARQLFAHRDRIELVEGFCMFLPGEQKKEYVSTVRETLAKEVETLERESKLIKEKVDVIIKLHPKSRTSFSTCTTNYRHLKQHIRNFGSETNTLGQIDSLVRDKRIILQEMHTYLEENDDELLFGKHRDGQADDAAGHKISIDDFEIIKPISRGAFGSVLLAQKKATGDVYAIKVLKKEEMQAKNQQQHILNERNVLALAQNPYVVKMFYSFQSRLHLYMVMEYIPGGDLFSLLKELGCLSDGLTQQYVAEITLSLEYLHKHGIVHRDLKPDNVLIASNGHLKLTDFGLSRIGLVERQEENKEWQLFRVFSDESDAHETVGTPDYIAPEVFLGTGHGHPVDWWALGCITYELLLGITPFYGESIEEIFQNIVDNSIEWPEEDEMDISATTKDFITQLLVVDPNLRIGTGDNDADDVKKHPYMTGICWDTLMSQESLFVPQTGDILDTSYFDARNDYFPMDDVNVGAMTQADPTSKPKPGGLAGMADWGRSDDGRYISGIAGGMVSREGEFDDDDGDMSLDHRVRGFSFINVAHLQSTNEQLNVHR